MASTSKSARSAIALSLGVGLGLGLIALAAGPARAGGYQIVKLALDGEPAPGTGGSYDFDFMRPSLDQAGQVAFATLVSGGSAAAGVFRADAGGVTPIALAGEATPLGGTYASIFGAFPGVSQSGEVSFLGVVMGGSVTHALFVDGGVAGSSRVAPGDASPIGGTYTATPSELSQHGQTASGGVVFQSAVSGGSRASGVFLATSGGHSSVALEGDPAPGTGGGTYASFAAPAASPAGDVVFTATLTSGSAAKGIFLHRAGSDSAVALLGETAPDTGGGTYADLLMPAVGSGGDVAFIAGVDDGGAGIGGLFVEVDGTDRAVVVENGTAPGTGGGTWTTLTSLPAVDAGGRVPFSATLSGGNVAGGLFLFDPTSGETAQVVLAGEPAPDSGGQTFASFGYLAIDASGRIATLATLSGGGQGLFLVSPPTVPALPGAGLALVALVLAGTGCVLLRRSRALAG